MGNVVNIEREKKGAVTVEIQGKHTNDLTIYILT